MEMQDDSKGKHRLVDIKLVCRYMGSIVGPAHVIPKLAYGNAAEREGDCECPKMERPRLELRLRQYRNRGHLSSDLQGT